MSSSSPDPQHQQQQQKNAQRPKAMDPEHIWIYHERQEALLCGQHALNNLAQQRLFTVDGLAEIAWQLDQLELVYMAENCQGGVASADYQRRVNEGSGNVDAAGNFSIQVLKAAIQELFPAVTLPHLSHEDLVKDGKDITEYQGFLCHKSNHWFAIRNIGGRFWNLNSTLERPVVVSHFQLATEMEQWKGQGYTIFCVPTGLPHGGVLPSQPQEQQSSSSLSAWHKMSDLLQGKSTFQPQSSAAAQSARQDPWKTLTGKGMRLDGKKSQPLPQHNTNTNHHDNMDLVVDGLTEEEQLQLALAASLDPTTTTTSSSQARVVSQDFTTTTSTTGIPALPTAVPPEPAANDPMAVKIQFRFLPQGTRWVRRFHKTDTVGMVYAFAATTMTTSSSSSQQTVDRIEMLYGFPQTDLLSKHSMDTTIEEAGLAGQSITCRNIA